MENAAAPTELYLITPEKIVLPEFKAVLTELVAEVPVSCLQLRLPDLSLSEFKETVDTLAPIAWDKDIAVLLCDEADLVKEMDLDGVHLEYDNSAKNVKAARKMIGDEKSLGVSCGSSKHEAMLAGEAGADYISFGPLFPSPTKGIPAEEGVKEALSWWAIMMELPCVAIGGLSLDNVETALETKAEFIAPLSGIWSAEQGPVAAAKAFYDATLSFK